MHYLKPVLDDIIETAFCSDPKKALYLKFYIVNAEDAAVTRACGSYDAISYEVRLYNLANSGVCALKQAIHEVAHRIDWCNRGTTCHDSQYLWYLCELLETAFDKELLSPDDYNKEKAANGSEWNMISPMLEAYVPRKEVSLPRTFTVLVPGKCGEADGEKLLKRGYQFSEDAAGWYLNVPFRGLDDEARFIYSSGLKANVEENFMIPYKITAKKGSYEARSQLKEEGFRYNGRFWVLLCKNGREAKTKLTSLQTVLPNVSLTAAAL